MQHFKIVDDDGKYIILCRGIFRYHQVIDKRFDTYNDAYNAYLEYTDGFHAILHYPHEK